MRKLKESAVPANATIGGHVRHTGDDPSAPPGQIWADRNKKRKRLRTIMNVMLARKLGGKNPNN